MKKKNIKSILFLNTTGSEIELINELAIDSKFEINLFMKDASEHENINSNVAVLDIIGNSLFDIVFTLPQELKEKETKQIIENSSLTFIIGDSPIAFSSILGFIHDESLSNLLGVRIVKSLQSTSMLEFVCLPPTSRKALDQLSTWSQDLGLNISLLQYDIPGGGVERIRVPLESEIWKMVREGIITPSELNSLSKENFNLDEGFLDSIRRSIPDKRSRVAKQLFITSMNDGRFRPEYDQFPPDAGENWDKLTDKYKRIEKSSEIDKPEKILVIGTPHIVDLWCEKIYKITNASVMPKGIKLWDLGNFSESVQKEINENGPYDMILEVLIAPTEERQKLLEVLVGVAKENTQFWVHTLNTPATVTVQVIPEQLCAIGFSGIPGFNESDFCELSKPKNSNRTEFNKAVKAAQSLGFEPVEVADEPGAVTPRLLATLVNATSFLAREGIVTSEIEADRIAARAISSERGPLVFADVYGLDTIEAVLIGLYAFNGIDRYRVSPLITMRIESGALGNVTDKGYYRV